MVNHPAWIAVYEVAKKKIPCSWSPGGKSQGGKNPRRYASPVRCRAARKKPSQLAEVGWDKAPESLERKRLGTRMTRKEEPEHK